VERRSQVRKPFLALALHVTVDGPELCGRLSDEVDQTRGNASKDFGAAEEVFDEMPPLVFFSVMLGSRRLFAVICAGPLAERNDGLHVVGAQPTGIKSLIADRGQTIDAE
jgi:hypothetical protein